jgi:hypothetical protein
VVRAVTTRLRALGYNAASPAGQFDAALKSLVKVFQLQHVDAFHRPLLSDGEIGPLTWGALFDEPAVAAGGGGQLARAALAVAQTQIGVMEDPVGSNRGPMVDQYLRATDTAPGKFWCMAFIYWCFQQAAAQLGVANTFPRTAGCLDAWNRSANFRVQQSAARANPALVVPGSIFIFDHGGGLGHAGFVVEQRSGALRTVEGNSNDNGSSNGVGVFALNRRNVMNAGLKGFIVVP